MADHISSAITATPCYFIFAIHVRFVIFYKWAGNIERMKGLESSCFLLCLSKNPWTQIITKQPYLSTLLITV